MLSNNNYLPNFNIFKYYNISSFIYITYVLNNIIYIYIYIYIYI